MRPIRGGRTRNGAGGRGERARESDFETNDQVIFDFSVTISDRLLGLNLGRASKRGERARGRRKGARGQERERERAHEREICMFEMARAIIIMMITNKHTCFLSPRLAYGTGDAHST